MTATAMSESLATEREPTIRVSEQGARFETSTIRDFLKRALADDAVADQVTELLFEHVVNGRQPASLFGPSMAVATSLAGYIEEVLQTATAEDWQAVADELIADARELLGDDGVPA